MHRPAKLPKEDSASPARSAKDPGHLLASISCASAQAKGERGGTVMQRHDLALDTTLGPGAFSHSKVRAACAGRCMKQGRANAFYGQWPQEGIFLMLLPHALRWQAWDLQQGWLDGIGCELS